MYRRGEVADHGRPREHQKLELLLAGAEQDQGQVSHPVNDCRMSVLTISLVIRGLIAKHARLLAVKPTMWGGRTPTAAGVEKLATACINEWTRALDQMLRNWSTASTSGR